MHGISANELKDGRSQDWVTNNSQYRDGFPTLGGRGKRGPQNAQKKKTGFEFLENNAGKKLVPAKYSDSIVQIRK